MLQVAATGMEDEEKVRLKLMNAGPKYSKFAVYLNVK
jgi:hypothetical protein